MLIEKNTVVSIDYRLTDNRGNVLGSSEGREPLTYLHGAKAMIPGLETALEGRAKGDEFETTISPASGYGERNESLVGEVPRSQFKDVNELHVGMQFRVATDTGNDLQVTVVEVGDETVTVDGNHPLAGATLFFEVTVRDVREATEEEVKRGNVPVRD